MGKLYLNLTVLVVVTLISVTAIAAPFYDNYVVENTNSTLFSKDIDINKFGNNLQKRNVQVKNVDYNYSQRAEQMHRASVVNGAEQVSKTTSQVSLQNNSWNGYTRIGVDATVAQNVTFNRPMTIDAYSARTQVTDAFVDDVVVIGNIQKVDEDGIYGDGAQPGPIADVTWGFMLCALLYVVIRCRYQR